VQVVNAFHNPYPESFAFDGDAAAPADRFERTVVVVAIDAERFYVVDHFQVRGGHQHDQSWHALPVEPEVPALDWAVQATGTLAGPEVKEFDAYTDRWGRRHDDGGFASFVTQVRRAPLRGPAVWTWRSGLPEGDAVALHVVPLGGPAEVILGKGRSLLPRRLARRGSRRAPRGRHHPDPAALPASPRPLRRRCHPA